MSGASVEATASPEDGLAKMCKLIDEYGAAMHAGGYNPAAAAFEPARARDTAFAMLGVVNSLYNIAYRAAAEQARREGKAL